jgi:TldD protein
LSRIDHVYDLLLAYVSDKGIRKALDQARKNAKFLAKHIGPHTVNLGRGRLSTASFVGPGCDEILKMSVAEKLQKVIDYERALANSSASMQTSTCRYNEIVEEKAIVTSDGACAELKIVQPEISLSAIAEKNGERSTTQTAAGVSGGWNCLYAHPSLNDMVAETAKRAVDLLSAKNPEGGKKTCILSPSVVGLLCHEAIGHTVEADFVKAGSVAAGKIGERVGSDLVSIADSGKDEFTNYAVGNLPFDDEGVETERTMIIKNGTLTSYLHNRETAAEFGVDPTGNARAWSFKDEPIIRMRNTYFLPGNKTLAQMIAEVEDGYLVEGAGGGQADSNGEFMFGTGWAWRIKNGKKAEMLRKATLSGIAFDVLKTVDAVSKEFMWDLGTGYCGKGQPAKVDAGGPYVRCQITVGGEQK